MAVKMDASNTVLADSGDPGDVREMVAALPEGSRRVLLPHSVLQLLGRLAARSRNLTLMLGPLEAVPLFHPALSSVLSVRPTRWSWTDFAFRS